MSIVVVATIVPKPEDRAEVIAALEETIATIHEHDEGCELYALNEGKDRLVMIEKYVSMEALAAHGQSEALQNLVKRLDGKLAGELDLQVLTPHPAGDAVKGTL